jgi:orotate phosphoribosyltransferase
MATSRRKSPILKAQVAKQNYRLVSVFTAEELFEDLEE